jgi:hypothetical protein
LYRTRKLLNIAALVLLVGLLALPSVALGNGRDDDDDRGRRGQSENRGRGHDRGNNQNDDRDRRDDDDDGRVGICHLTGNGDYIFITVSSRGNAANAHERHGDIVDVNSEADCPGDTGSGGSTPASLVMPAVNVLRNPLGMGGAPVGTCPVAGPCTLRLRWSEPAGATNTLMYGVGVPGTGFAANCTPLPSTTPTCEVTLGLPAGAVIHYQATSSLGGSTLQTPDTALTL